MRGKSCIELRDELVPFVSDIAHAIYLGGELMKAERALKEGKGYIQDA
jgi:dihydropteroate synthase